MPLLSCQATATQYCLFRKTCSNPPWNQKWDRPPFQYSAWSSSWSKTVRQEGYKSEKKSNYPIFFFADGMRVNIRGTPKMLKNKKFQQKGRIENQFTKSIAFLWTNKHAKKVVINTLLFTIECNEISWNKLNWGGQRPLQWKLQIPKGNDWGGHQKVENLLCSLISRINIVNSTESQWNRQRHSSQKYKNAF